MYVCALHKVSSASVKSCPFLEGFFKNPSFEIAMSCGQVGGHLSRFTFWLTSLKNLSLMPLGVFLVLPVKTVCIKCQILFSEKNQKIISNWCMLKFLLSMLCVKDCSIPDLPWNTAPMRE